MFEVALFFLNQHGTIDDHHSAAFFFASGDPTSESPAKASVMLLLALFIAFCWSSSPDGLQYYQDVTLTGQSTTIIDAEVLIEFHAAVEIASGRLLDDVSCGDLRIFEVDSMSVETELEYWIESGCWVGPPSSFATSTPLLDSVDSLQEVLPMQIWVKIPSLSGNFAETQLVIRWGSPSIANAESGSYLVPMAALSFDSNCHVNTTTTGSWTHALLPGSSCNDRISRLGDVGDWGTLTDPGGHDHIYVYENVISYEVYGNTNPYLVRNDTVGDYEYTPCRHTHSLEIETVETLEDWVPSVTVGLCVRNYAVTTDGDGGMLLNQGMMVWVDDEEAIVRERQTKLSVGRRPSSPRAWSSPLDSDWPLLDSLDSLFLRLSNATTPLLQVDVAQGREQFNHSHGDYIWIYTTHQFLGSPQPPYVWSFFGPTSAPPYDHRHLVMRADMAECTQVDANPDFVWVHPFVATRDAVAIPEGAVLFSQSTPPMGWQLYNSSLFAEYYPRLSSDIGLAGVLVSGIHYHGASLLDPSDNLTGVGEVEMADPDPIDGHPVNYGDHEHAIDFSDPLVVDQTGARFVDRMVPTPSSCKYSAIMKKLSAATAVAYAPKAARWHICFELRNDDVRACRERGVCVDVDTCDCPLPFHGLDCAIQVDTAEFVEETRLVIGFKTTVDQIADLLLSSTSTEFVCEDMILNLVDSGQSETAVTCHFEMPAINPTAMVVIFAGIPLSSWTEVIVSTFSNQSVAVPITPFAKGLSVTATAGLIGGVVGACLICLVVGVLVAGVVISCLRQRAKRQAAVLDRLNQLEDLDILLMEQEARDSGGYASIRINKKLFEVDFESVRLVRVAGSGGSSSVVYEAVWEGRTVAFKLLTLPFAKSEDVAKELFAEFEREVSVLISVRHPNILQLYGATVRVPRVGMILEWCPEGDLHRFVSSRLQSEDDGPAPGLPMSERIRLLLEIASALGYLHGRGIIHRDVKTENVVVTANAEAKVMDFGVSRMGVEDATNRMTSRVGTMAPEVFSGNAYSMKCDVFSYAIVMFEVLTGNFDPYDLASRISGGSIEGRVAHDEGFRPRLSEKELKMVPAHLQRLMRRCWSHSAHDRPSFEEIVVVLGGGDGNEQARQSPVGSAAFGHHVQRLVEAKKALVRLARDPLVDEALRMEFKAIEPHLKQVHPTITEPEMARLLRAHEDAL